MENKIYSISEAFSMQPCHISIGDYRFIGVDRKIETTVNEIIHEVIQTGSDERTDFYVGYDKDLNKLFQYRVNAMNVKYC